MDGEFIYTLWQWSFPIKSNSASSRKTNAPGYGVLQASGGYPGWMPPRSGGGLDEGECHGIDLNPPTLVASFRCLEE